MNLDGTNKEVKNRIEIYTDGAYSSSRGQGGIGIIILRNNKVILPYSRMYQGTSNNQMELAAIIIALRAIKEPADSIIIYTDSMYCIGCATLGWKRNKNKRLWEEFDKQYERVQSLCPDIKFEHVKGHNGNKYNEIVDAMAVKASQYI